MEKRVKSFESFLLEAQFNNQGYNPTTVAEIQRKLVALGLLSPKSPKGANNVDGKFGEFSKAALQTFQQNKSLKDQSGNITPESLGLLQISATTSAKTSAPVAPSPQIKTQAGPQPGSAAVPLSTYGKFTPGQNLQSPLVMVYGGIPVAGRQSGQYMYDYFNKTGNKYNLFVANSHNVDGPKSYEAVKQKLMTDGIRPSKKILYLFSGGYKPGKPLLERVGSGEFDKIYLVDIWMGNSSVADFYKKLASENPDKVEYYFTDFGANNPNARNFISSVVSKNQKVGGHMETNLNAVNNLLAEV